MARKAQRAYQLEEKSDKRKKSRAVSYTRLSKIEKRDSIVHQKAIIREYAQRQADIQLVLELEDCNRSGTNFNREGFQKLIKAIERQEVDCVIVKDLSRLGRNMEEVSKYLEWIFPRLGIRFISILDGYDSEQIGSFDELFLLQLKCLLHESYAKDISRKIHASVELLQRRGEWIGSVPYGYRQARKGEIVTTEAAEIVQWIYQLALEGETNRRIAACLDQIGCATPREYQKTGILYSIDKGKEQQWSACSVGRILEKEGVIIGITN